MRGLIICMITCLWVAAKDNFNASFLLLRVQEVERFDTVDAENFQGQRIGFGFLLESEQIEKLSVETGLFKANRQYSVMDQGRAVVEEVERLHLPALLRWNLLEGLSLGLGGYAAYPVSDSERAVESDFSTGESTSSQKDEYGGQASIAVQMPLPLNHSETRFFIDIRWLEPSNPKKGEETNNLVTMAGVRVEI